MVKHSWKAGAEFEALMERAARDATFRRTLRADPRGTLKRELGMPVPGEVEIEVVEETATRAYLVLPVAQPPKDGQELSDEQLGAVAGGTGATSVGSSSDINSGVKKAIDL
jgi:hypothetical protein